MIKPRYSTPVKLFALSDIELPNRLTKIIAAFYSAFCSFVIIFL